MIKIDKEKITFNEDVPTVSSELLSVIGFMQTELDVDICKILEEVKTAKTAAQATESINMIQNLYLYLADEED